MLVKHNNPSRWIFDSGANQHMTDSISNLSTVVNVFYLKIYVKHPNGTKAYIQKIRNLKLSDKVTLFDVFVIPKYCVSLMFVQKWAKDNKLFVGFDDSNCYTKNLKTRTIFGTSKKVDGLYVLDPSDKTYKNCNFFSI